jgi:hypothetical protein
VVRQKVEWLSMILRNAMDVVSERQRAVLPEKQYLKEEL